MNGLQDRLRQKQKEYEDAKKALEAKINSLKKEYKDLKEGVRILKQDTLPKLNEKVRRSSVILNLKTFYSETKNNLALSS